MNDNTSSQSFIDPIGSNTNSLSQNENTTNNSINNNSDNYSIDTNYEMITESTINKFSSKKINKPKIAMLYYLWINFKKQVGNWVFIAIHLFIIFMISLVPVIIYLSSPSEFGKTIPIGTGLYYPIFISIIAINTFFIIIYGIYLGLQTFGNSKSDGIELLLVSKPISRKDIATMRIVFLIIVAAVYMLSMLIWITICYAISLSHYNNQPFATVFVVIYRTNVCVAIFGTALAFLFGILLFSSLTSMIAARLSKKTTSGIMYGMSTLLYSITTIVSYANITGVSNSYLTHNYININDAFMDWFINKYKDVTYIQSGQTKPSIYQINKTEFLKNIKNDSTLQYNSILDIRTPYNYQDIQGYDSLYSFKFMSFFNPNTPNLPPNTSYYDNLYTVITDAFNKTINLDNTLDPTQKTEIKSAFTTTMNDLATSTYYSYSIDIYKYDLFLPRIYADFYTNNGDYMQKIINKYIFKSEYTSLCVLDYISPTSSVSFMQGLGQNAYNGANLYWTKKTLWPIGSSTNPNDYNGWILGVSTMPYNLTLSSTNPNYIVEKLYELSTASTYNPIWSHMILSAGFISLFLFLAWYLYQRRDFA